MTETGVHRHFQANHHPRKIKRARAFATFVALTAQTRVPQTPGLWHSDDCDQGHDRPEMHPCGTCG